MLHHLRFRIILGFAAIYLIWGSTYLAIRIGVETLPPFLMIGLRFLVGGLFFYGLTRICGAEPPRAIHWQKAAISGCLMTVGGTGLVTWAEQTVPSGLTAILLAMMPTWMVLADWLAPGGRRPSLPVVGGFLLGFTGVFLLVNPLSLGNMQTVDLIGALAVVAASILWSIGSVYSRYAAQHPSKMLAAGMQMLCGGGILLLISLLAGELSSFDYAATMRKSWLALGYMIVFGSLGYASYVWLLSVSTVAKVSTYAYVNPIIALTLGHVIAGETLSMWALGCSAMIITAVIIVVTVQVHAPRPAKVNVGGGGLSECVGPELDIQPAKAECKCPGM